MIKIQDWQMAELARGRTEDVNGLLASRVAEVLADDRDDPERATPEAIANWIAIARAAGDRYGFSRDADIERYLMLMLDLGDDFDTSVDWANEILTREDYTGHVRIDVLWATWNGHFGDGPEDIL